MLNRIIALVAIVVILMAGVGAISSQYQSAVRGATDATTQNESITPTNGDTITLAESNRDVVYNDSVTVSQNGTVYEPSGNYTWNDANGTIAISSSSGLDGNTTAYVDYGFHQPSSNQRLARDVSMLPAQYSGGLVEVLSAAMILGAVAIMFRVGMS